MSPCPHDISEQDTAAHADGLCPLCLQARVQHLTDALRPFVDGLPATEAAKMIDKRYRGLNPLQIVVTKFQFQAAKDALKIPGAS